MEPTRHPDGVRARFAAQLAEGETSDRTFGLVIGAIFLALSCAPALRHHPPKLWMAVLGVCLIALGGLLPRSLHTLKLGWLFLGFAMGLVISPAVLGILFYGVITPCAAIMRLTGADPLRLRDRRQSTFWLAREGPASSMQDPF